MKDGRMSSLVTVTLLGPDGKIKTNCDCGCDCECDSNCGDCPPKEEQNG